MGRERCVAVDAHGCILLLKDCRFSIASKISCKTADPSTALPPVALLRMTF